MELDDDYFGDVSFTKMLYCLLLPSVYYGDSFFLGWKTLISCIKCNVLSQNASKLHKQQILMCVYVVAVGAGGVTTRKPNSGTVLSNVLEFSHVTSPTLNEMGMQACAPWLRSAAAASVTA